MTVRSDYILLSKLTYRSKFNWLISSFSNFTIIIIFTHTVITLKIKNIVGPTQESSGVKRFGVVAWMADWVSLFCLFEKERANLYANASRIEKKQKDKQEHFPSGCRDCDLKEYDAISSEHSIIYSMQVKISSQVKEGSRNGKI